MASAGGVDDLFVGHKQAQHVKENLMTTATEGKRKAAGSRVSAAKTRSTSNPAVQFLSPAQRQELDDMDKMITQITSSKKEALAFLKEAGIFNSSGKLAKIYRTA